MDDELRNVLGKAASRVVLPSNNKLNPKAPPKPRRPNEAKEVETEVPPTPPGCIAPIFPIVPESKVHEYMREDRRPDDVIGNYQKGKIDPELNELALREVAAERGISVEELLARNPDKKLDQKLEFANMEQPTPPTPRSQTMSLEEARRILAEADKKPAPETSEDDKELQALEMRKAAINEKKRLEALQKSNPAPEPKAKPQHPLLKSLRQKLSLDAIEPAVVEIEGFRFGMMPPPGSLQPWILEKIAAANQIGSEPAIMITIRTAMVSVALVTINDVPLAEILGLTELSVPKNPMEISPELRQLMAQTVWEMATGTSTLPDLFAFNPQWVTRLYEAYDKSFKDYKLKGQNDHYHRFVCPVPACPEIYDLEVPVSGKVFCKIHGVETQDQGALEALNSLPLF
jgi:hypothetical protein